jgi:hypothetical protein
MAEASVTARIQPVIPDSSCQIDTLTRIETKHVILPFLCKEIENFQNIFGSKISTVLGSGEQLIVNIVGGYRDDCSKFVQHYCDNQSHGSYTESPSAWIGTY